MPIFIPRALASLERDTMIPLSLFDVITQTGLPCKEGLSTRSQDAKNESQSIRAIIRCFMFVVFAVCSMVAEAEKMSITE